MIGTHALLTVRDTNVKNTGIVPGFMELTV